MRKDELIRKALSVSGYGDSPTEDNLIQCFLDYVDQGVFRGLTLEEAEDMIREGDITIEQIARNLMGRVS